MKIKTVSIKRFRGIEEIKDFKLNDLTVLIGDNGTSKTTILEAINFSLSPSFLSGRIKHTDFYNGEDEPIEIMLLFDNNFVAQLPDGYQYIAVECNRIFLKIKKRDRQSNSKAFCDIVVVEHYVVPVLPRIAPGKGWEIARKTGSGKFKFDERQLTFPVKTDKLPKTFYYGKSRDKQIQRGFNSSISSVFDDFNWRFMKQIRKTSNTFFADKEKLEEFILDNVDDKAIEKTFDELNVKLKTLNIDDVSLSFFDGNIPFDSAFLNQKKSNVEIPVSNLGSGIEMIISLLFLETLASLSKEKNIIIIDEPELHLHPKLQISLITYLKSISSNTQIIINSHSPYVFKNCLSNPNIELVVTNKISNKVSLSNSSSVAGYFPWSPSWGEINYNAYNLPTVEFHNELYGFIQEKNAVWTEKDFEAFVVSNGSIKNKTWIKEIKSVPCMPLPTSIMTYIRNFIHHPENKSNIMYTEIEFEESIKEMIRILKI